MDQLFTFWLFTLVALASIILYAWSRRESRPKTTYSVSEVFFGEYRALLRDMLTLLQVVRPHGVRVVSHGVRLANSGRMFFVDRIYGKITMPRGVTASFFLKQIAEDKVERKSEGG